MTLPKVDKTTNLASITGLMTNEPLWSATMSDEEPTRHDGGS
jgi:hypothetical protein